MQAKPQTVIKNKTKTGRSRKSIFQLTVRQKVGRGAGVTDKTIEDIEEYFDPIC